MATPLSHSTPSSLRTALVVAALATVIGAVVILVVAAASSAAFKETEDGALTPGAQVVSVSGASGGKAVKFGVAATPAPTSVPTPTPVAGPGRNLNVSNQDQLTAAIADVRPGDTITLADGSYTGKRAVGSYTGSFSMTTAGTAAAPITLRGGRGAVIDGDGPGGHYGLYLVGAHYWRIAGISVTSATKGIVLDGSSHVTLDGIKVFNTGQEGVHFRAFSSDNVISNSEVTQTGTRTAGFGEGVYIGSTNSNWGTYSGGKPDTSDRNQVLNNTITNTAAENIDIKEGSTGGLIKGNKFDGSGTGQIKDGVREAANSADSWIDVKGNGYTVTGNTGAHALSNGIEIHNVYAGWGKNNVFHGNTLNVDAYIKNDPKHSGFGFWAQDLNAGNIIGCDNIVTNAISGFYNGNCTP